MSAKTGASFPRTVFYGPGASPAPILLAAGAGAAERFAAQELGTHLRTISGAEFPVRDLSAAQAAGAEPVAGPAILVGRNALTERLLAGTDWAGLGEDGCELRRVDSFLVLAGAAPRGTLYAVYEFLDRVLGCRWLTPTAAVLPVRPEIVIDELQHRHVPPFRYRECYDYRGYADPDWQARNRLNGHFGALDAAHGGHWRYLKDGFGHTWFLWVPPEIHFADNPEFYSEIGGRRQYVAAQLCLTNERLPDVMADSIRRHLRAEPGARVVSVTQMDWPGRCQCANCRRLEEREGAAAGPIIQFVNQVAERLEPEFPQVRFDTFAYTWSIEPPRQVRPRPSVMIRLCHLTPCCNAHPVDECAVNRPFLKLLEAWSGIAPELFVWDYYTNFHQYLQPFPDLDAIAADIPLFARHRVTGLFCQADGMPPKGCGELGELRAWVLARLMWDPTRQAWGEAEYFLRHYYGPAAQPLREYLERLYDPVRHRGVHISIYDPLDTPVTAGDFLPRSQALFCQAAGAVAADADLTDRVLTARLPLDYLDWQRRLEFRVVGDRYEPAAPELGRRLREFFDRAGAHGIGALRERGIAIDGLRQLGTGFDLVRLTNGRLTATVAPGLGGRLLSLHDGASDTEWLHWGRPGQSDYPFAGGYEEYSQIQWRTPGWSEDYRVLLRSSSAVALEAALSSGLIFRRTYLLAPDQLAIESALFNPGAHWAGACLRTLPEFDAAGFDELQVGFLPADGCWVERAPWTASGDRAGSRFLDHEEMPRGGVCRLARGQHVLQIRLDGDTLSRVLLDWDRDLDLVRLGFDTEGLKLEPGKSFAFRQEWRVL